MNKLLTVITTLATAAFFLLPPILTVEAAEANNWEANSVAVDSQGNVIVTGSIYDDNKYKFYTVKQTEDEGNILWTREFSEYDYNDAKAIAVDSQDNIIVAGAVNASGLLQGYDYCLVKYDADGTELWIQKYDRKMYDVPWAVTVDSQDNIIVTGISGRIEFNPVNINLDFWTIKCDTNGNMLYEDSYDISEVDTSQGIAVDSQDNIIVSGLLNSSEGMAYYTIKYSSTLSKIWEKSFSNGVEDAGSGVAVDSENNIIVTGGSSDGSSVNYGTIKYTPEGVLLSSWPKFYDSGGKDDARAVAVDFDDNIIVSGSSNGEWLTIKYDSDGDMLWERNPGFRGEARSIAVDGGNNIIVTGYREDTSIRNFYTIKYRANGDVIWDFSYAGSSPVADFTWMQKTRSRTIKFSDSSLDDRGLQSWQWDFGDGSSPSYEKNPEHSYTLAKSYTVTLIVTDTDGNTDMVSDFVSVTNVRPVVDFVYSPLNPLTNETITFSDKSEDYDGDIDARLWDFNDGETSTMQNPTHSYTAPGTYIVKLSITDNDQETVTRSKSITINYSGGENIPPVANYTFSPLDPQPSEDITFDAISSDDPDGYIDWDYCQWDWNNDGIYDATGIEAVYSWSEEGDYDVTLQVMDNNGSTNTITKTIHVESGPPMADFTYSIDHLVVTFSDQSSDFGGTIAAWHWDFGDNSTSTENNPIHEYPKEGTYTVSLTVTDEDGNNDTLSKTFTLEKEEDGGGIPGFTSVFFLFSILIAVFFFIVLKKKNQ